MTTPNCVDKILQRLKDGLLVNLDKHSLENVRTILEEETKSAPKIAGSSLRAKSCGTEPVDVLAHEIPAQGGPRHLAMGSPNDPDYQEALKKTASGEGFSWNQTEASAPAEPVEEGSDAKG